MAVTTLTREAALTAMYAADARFSLALIAAYGPRRAGAMRYQPSYPDHPDVAAAAAAFVTAANVWRALRPARPLVNLDRHTGAH